MKCFRHVKTYYACALYAHVSRWLCYMYAHARHENLLDLFFTYENFLKPMTKIISSRIIGKVWKSLKLFFLFPVFLQQYTFHQILFLRYFQNCIAQDKEFLFLLLYKWTRSVYLQWFLFLWNSFQQTALCHCFALSILTYSFLYLHRC